MKKILFAIAMIIGLGLSAAAQYETGCARSFSVPGAPQTLDLTYINHVPLNGHDGTLRVVNNSDVNLRNVHIKVSVLITWEEMVDVPYVGRVPQKTTKTLILCDDYFDISAHESETYSSSRRGVIKGGPHKANKKYDYNIEVTF